MNAWEMAQKLSDVLTDENDPAQWDVSASAEPDEMTALIRVYGELDEFKITIKRWPRK